MTTIDNDLSDLFFSLDLDDARVTDRLGNFSHFNDEALHEEATTLLIRLRRLGAGRAGSISPQALVDDFKARL